MKKINILVCVILVTGLIFTSVSSFAAVHKYIACAPFECPYFGTWHEGARAAAEHLGVELTTATANWDPSRETSLIESAVTGGADGVIVARVNLDAFVPCANRINKLGVAIVSTDGPFHRGPRLAHFTTDAMDIGKILGREILEVLENSGKVKPWNIVVLAGLPGTYDGTIRTDGAMASLQPYIDKGEINIIYEIANFSRSLALTKMSAILSKTHVDAVIAANDDMALGALKACEAAGLKLGKDVFFMGVDLIPEVAKLIGEGKYLGSVTQAPWLEGYWGVATLYFYQEYGGKPDSPVMPVPYFAVDKTNLKTYEKLIKYNGPPPPEFFTNCSGKYMDFISKYWPGFSWPE